MDYKVVFEDQELTEEELTLASLKEGELPPWELEERRGGERSNQFNLRIQVRLNDY